MNDKHTNYELKVFKRFASVCELPIILESIEKRNPPEPDITCNVDGFGVLAIELTELIDRGFANLVGKQIETKKELTNYYNELEKKEKQDFYRCYADAIIFIHFENSLSLRQRKKLFPFIFEHLLNLKDHFEGNTLQNNLKLKKKLKWITISRGVNGPIFDDVPVSSIGDPTLAALKMKLSKVYRTNFPMHLLAFIDLNPMFPEHIWLPSAMDYVKRNIKQSQFEKIWIFDFQKNKIKGRFPLI